ncbi:exonuclease [Pseudomonas phage ZCPS1]|uniref:Exonuclease n=2 Tax=Bruynoghevirus TaxID=545932 RepID=A0A6G9LG09_9CAUD|nr:5'-3' exonuclease [Pseudomonas phage MR299-2]QIQ64387.1 exonuclease [Pseudomonas phage Epa1]UPO63104.1 exonuclease [Pseudomonas phage ZCPS1]UZV42295.1 flap endonuclease [Pseudomonas phage Ka1]WOR80483.1 exonuclease [Pseudomonas phage PSP30]
MIAGIDGDVLRYELGHIAMKKEHIFDIEVVRPWPEEEVNELVDKKIEQIIERVGADDYEVYLTGKDNFRLELATIRQYKGTRVGNTKPHHWQTVSDRLKDKWGAVTVNGIEADDWLGVRGTEEGDNFTACSRDKDIRQITECHHYSWACGDKQPELGPFRNEGLGRVSASWRLYGKKKPQKSWKLEGYGTAFLYGQLLVGDSVDNIPGCPEIGPKSAADLLGHLTTEKDLFQACAYEYQKVYGDNWKEYLTENFRLLYLIRDRNWFDIEQSGNELNCRVIRHWEIPYEDGELFY